MTTKAEVDAMSPDEFEAVEYEQAFVGNVRACVLRYAACTEDEANIAMTKGADIVQRGIELRNYAGVVAREVVRFVQHCAAIDALPKTPTRAPLFAHQRKALADCEAIAKSDDAVAGLLRALDEGLGISPARLDAYAALCEKTANITDNARVRDAALYCRDNANRLARSARTLREAVDGK
jgi:hypothetical protein